VLGIECSLNALLLCAKAFGGAVAALCAFWRGTLNLDQYRVINISAERAFNSFKIWFVTIAR
jgi:hypothetical protein